MGGRLTSVLLFLDLVFCSAFWLLTVLKAVVLLKNLAGNLLIDKKPLEELLQGPGPELSSGVTP